jgi:hypothetical protein
MGRDRAARDRHGLGRRPAQEQEQHAFAAHVEGAHAVIRPQERQIEDGLVERPGAIQVVHVERRFENRAQCRHPRLPGHPASPDCVPPERPFVHRLLFSSFPGGEILGSHADLLILN